MALPNAVSNIPASLYTGGITAICGNHGVSICELEEVHGLCRHAFNEVGKFMAHILIFNEIERPHMNDIEPALAKVFTSIPAKFFQ